MFKLTWKNIVKVKLPSKKKKVERERSHQAYFISREAAQSSIDSTPESERCFDWEITECGQGDIKPI